MQLKFTLIAILCVWFANGYAQINPVTGDGGYKQVKPVSGDGGLQIPYDTINLKNGYFLVFEKTEGHRYLRLKGPTVDTLIRQINIKASESNLGHLDMDHDDYFTWASEASCYGVQVFHKATGYLMVSGCLLGKDTIHHIFYFVDWKDDFKLGIFNMETMKVELFPSQKTACNFWWECIDSKTLTETELTIEYYVPPKNKVKKIYKRQPG